MGPLTTNVRPTRARTPLLLRATFKSVPRSTIHNANERASAGRTRVVTVGGAPRLEVKVEPKDDDVTSRQLGEKPREGVRAILRSVVGSIHQHEKGGAAADGFDLKVERDELEPNRPAHVPDGGHRRV